MCVVNETRSSCKLHSPDCWGLVRRRPALPRRLVHRHLQGAVAELAEASAHTALCIHSSGIMLDPMLVLHTENMASTAQPRSLPASPSYCSKSSPLARCFGHHWLVGGAKIRDLPAQLLVQPQRECCLATHQRLHSTRQKRSQIHQSKTSTAARCMWNNMMVHTDQDGMSGFMLICTKPGAVCAHRPLGNRPICRCTRWRAG